MHVFVFHTTFFGQLADNNNFDCGGAGGGSVFLMFIPGHVGGLY